MQVRGRKVLHFDILLLASLRRIVSAASWAKECLAKAQGFIIRATHLTMAVELLRRVNPPGCLLYPERVLVFLFTSLISSLKRQGDIAHSFDHPTSKAAIRSTTETRSLYHNTHRGKRRHRTLKLFSRMKEGAGPVTGRKKRVKRAQSTASSSDEEDPVLDSLAASAPVTATPPPPASTAVENRPKKKKCQAAEAYKQATCSGTSSTGASGVLPTSKWSTEAPVNQRIGQGVRKAAKSKTDQG